MCKALEFGLRCVSTIEVR